MAQIVTIEIDQETGEVSVDLAGFKGKSCLEVVKRLESRGKNGKRQAKPEFYQAQNQANTVVQGK